MLRVGHLSLAMYERARTARSSLFLDELLAPYGKEMTWDIKAGLMGKREYFYS